MTTERLLHNSSHTERGGIIEGMIQEYRVWIVIIDNSSHIERERSNRRKDTRI